MDVSPDLVPTSLSLLRNTGPKVSRVEQDYNPFFCCLAGIILLLIRNNRGGK